jgi:hypothetical protein
MKRHTEAPCFMQEHKIGEVAFSKAQTYKRRKCYTAVSYFSNVCSLCSKTVLIFTDYYSVLQVDFLGSESGVLAFGS